MEFEDLSHRVIGCAIEVHRELGPGLLESTYEQYVTNLLEMASRTDSWPTFSERRQLKTTSRK